MWNFSFSEGEEWKRIRSAAKKQIIPRRVGNFAPTLSKFAEQFGNHLYSIRNPEGYVMDVQTQVNNYTLQGEIKYMHASNLQVPLYIHGYSNTCNCGHIMEGW